MVATTSFVFAASALVGLSQATPARRFISTRNETSYINYRGDGSVSMGWPDVSEWADFDSIFTANSATSAGACEWLGLAPNSDAENESLKNAILEVGDESGLDPRFILAAVYQESTGCVRVKTSYSPNDNIRNPGLLQCGDGDHTCNDVEAGVDMLDPCPDEQIYGMITDGVGLTTEWGLMQVVERESGATDVSKYYKGAVLYNSGILPESGNLGEGRSNPCYASDIANRVMGWVADQSPCDRETIGDL